MSGVFSTFRTTASALTAQRLRMDVISNNIANAETTRTENGGPYRRQQVVFAAKGNRQSFAAQLATASMRSRAIDSPGSGVEVSKIITDDTPGNKVYDPTHPDADADGFVEYPNVDVTTEMTDMLSATRSYEANVTIFNALKSMALKAIELGSK